MIRSKLISILCILCVGFLSVRGQCIDTVPHFANKIPTSIDENSSTNKLGEYTFKTNQILLPASLFAVGALGTVVKPYKELNHIIRNKVTDWRGNNKIKIDDYIQYLPTATHLFLGFTKVPHHNTFLQRLTVDATSTLSLAILTNVFKYTFREKRPDSNSRNSFPSGHTATAFMGAELMRIEYGPYWGLGGYCVATAVGLLRIYNGRHWLNDVIAGAGIGILCARIGYWMLPLYNKWFFKKVTIKSTDRSSLSFSAVPAYNYYESSFTINCIIDL